MPVTHRRAVRTINLLERLVLEGGAAKRTNRRLKIISAEVGEDEPSALEGGFNPGTMATQPSGRAH